MDDAVQVDLFEVTLRRGQAEHFQRDDSGVRPPNMRDRTMAPSAG